MRSCQVAEDVAGVTLARQQRTIALSMQLDAARDIREQLKQCYRTHGMNHQDKCKVRGMNFIVHQCFEASLQLQQSAQGISNMHAHLRVTHVRHSSSRTSCSSFGKQATRTRAPALALPSSSVFHSDVLNFATAAANIALASSDF